MCYISDLICDFLQALLLILLLTLALVILVTVAIDTFKSEAQPVVVWLRPFKR